MDNLDHSILDLLRQNARAGYGDIGSVVGLSASAVKRRVDRLVADKVIRSFTIQVDPAVDGMSTVRLVAVRRGTAPSPARTGVAESIDMRLLRGSAVPYDRRNSGWMADQVAHESPARPTLIVPGRHSQSHTA